MPAVCDQKLRHRGRGDVGVQAGHVLADGVVKLHPSLLAQHQDLAVVVKDLEWEATRNGGGAASTPRPTARSAYSKAASTARSGRL